MQGYSVRTDHPHTLCSPTKKSSDMILESHRSLFDLGLIVPTLYNRQTYIHYTYACTQCLCGKNRVSRKMWELLYLCAQL